MGAVACCRETMDLKIDPNAPKGTPLHTAEDQQTLNKLVRAEASNDSSAPLLTEISPAVQQMRSEAVSRLFAGEGTCAHVAQMLKHLGCSNDQMLFFMTWSEVIGNPALMHPGVSVHVIVTTDMDTLEMQINGSSTQMQALADAYVRHCGIADAQFMELRRLVKATKAKQTMLWCRIRNMKGEQPASDAGYLVQGPMEFQVVDALLPDCKDRESLRRFVSDNVIFPASFGSSLFPVDPEKRLSFQMETENLKKGLLLSFFFFKNFGFAKPSDGVVRILSDNIKSARVQLMMAPKGLTWVEIELSEPKATAAKDLAETLSFSHEGASIGKLKAMSKLSETAPDSVTVYAADHRGYLVSIGFQPEVIKPSTVGQPTQLGELLWDSSSQVIGGGNRYIIPLKENKKKVNENASPHRLQRCTGQ